MCVQGCRCKIVVFVEPSEKAGSGGFVFAYSHGVPRRAMATERLPRRSKRARLLLFWGVSGEGEGAAL